MTLVEMLSKRLNRILVLVPYFCLFFLEWSVYLCTFFAILVRQSKGDTALELDAAIGYTVRGGHDISVKIFTLTDAGTNLERRTVYLTGYSYQFWVRPYSH